MATNVNLTPRLEDMVRRKVASGLYTSASEVFREALRFMEEQDLVRAARVEQLRQDIRE
jgi:antitoxin ParD1/3/4